MAKAKFLYDDFSTTSGLWYSSDPATGVVTGGRMRIKPTNAYDTVTSVNYYNLVGSYLGFQLVQNCAIGNGSNSIALYAFVDADNYISFIINGSRSAGQAAVYMRERVGGINSDTTITNGYDPAVHVWFRIREDSGSIFWETSTDGVSWTERRSKTSSFNVSSVSCLIEGGYWGSEAGTTYATIDNFNLWAGIPSLDKTEVLTDYFVVDDSATWYWSGGWAVSDGKLQAVPTSEYEYIITVDSFNFTDSHAGFELVRNNNAGTTDYGGSITVEFQVKIDSSNYVAFVLSGGTSANCVLRERVAGTNSDTSFTYNATKDKWIRLRHSSGTVFWETSRDGATWSIKRSKASSLDFNEVKCQFVTGYWNPEESDVGHVEIDNFNLFNLARLKEIGWKIGLSLPMGGIESGTVQQRVVFPDADWLWTPIPVDPVLDPNSENIGYYLAYPDVTSKRTISFGWYSNAVVYPSSINSSTPRYQMVVVGPDLYPDWGFDGSIFDDYQIPIPLGTQVPPGGDGHLVVIDPVYGKVFSFWQAHYDEGLDQWSASYGAISNMSGDGRDYVGSATATNLSRYAGIITLNEVAAGEIPHALFVASNICRPGAGWVSPSDPGGTPPFRYPATKSDGRNMASIPVEDTVVEGSRLQLDPSIDLEAIPGIKPIELAVGRAWQVYGAYVGDQGGNTWPPAVQAGSIELWQGQDYTVFDPETDDWDAIPVPPVLAQAGVGWDYFSLDNIPWVGNIRVLNNWDGT